MINVTDVISGLAVERLRSILKDEGYRESWLRIIAAPDTLEGASYLLDLDEEDESENDSIIHFFANNIHVVVDRRSNLLLDGAHIEPAVTLVLELDTPDS